MFVRSLRNMSCTDAVQGVRLTGLTYGNDAPCRTCGTTHNPTDRNKIVVETDKTEFIASRIAEKVGAGTSASKGIAGVGKQEGMVGVLIAAGGQMAVAMSGSGPRKEAAIQAAAKALYPDLVFAGNLGGGQIPTAAGGFLSQQKCDHSRFEGLMTEPGTCAGPKLIAHALRNNWARPFAMSEVWSAKVAKPGSKFAKSEPIESCNTCCKLIPLMLCG